MSAPTTIQNTQAFKRVLPKSVWGTLGLFLCLAILFPITSHAQFVLDEKVSFMYVKGTSTLHDWTAMVMKMDGTLDLGVNKAGGHSVTNTKVSLPVTSLKSEKEAMDGNMHKSLKAKSFPEIVYCQTGYAIQNGSTLVKGEITVAGVTRIIETPIALEETKEYVKISGEMKLKMTDFNVRAPEFLGGIFKTGNEVTVTFYLMYRNPVGMQ